MIKCIITTTSKRREYMASADETIGSILEQFDISLTVGQTNINGQVIYEDDLELPLSDYVTGDTCRIANVAKHDNN